MVCQSTFQRMHCENIRKVMWHMWSPFQQLTHGKPGPMFHWNDTSVAGAMTCTNESNTYVARLKNLSGSFPNVMADPSHGIQYDTRGGLRVPGAVLTKLNATTAMRARRAGFVKSCNDIHSSKTSMFNPGQPSGFRKRKGTKSKTPTLSDNLASFY